MIQFCPLGCSRIAGQVSTVEQSCLALPFTLLMIYFILFYNFQPLLGCCGVVLDTEVYMNSSLAGDAKRFRESIHFLVKDQSK